KDSECEKDGLACTQPHCTKAIGDGVCPDGTKWGFTIGTCGPETSIPGCTEKSCKDKFPANPDAAKCCELGFEADKAAFRCCYQHVKAGEDPGTPAKPVPCNGNETCPTCPDCRPPVVDCSIIADPAMKACCVAKGGFLWFMMDSCVHNSG